MKCNNCNSNIPNDSEFCPICGNKIEEIKERKTISISLQKAIGLFIIGIIIIGIIVTVLYYIINNDNIKESETNYNQQVASVKEEEVIPEDEKVTVSFIEGISNRIYEDRRIYNRTRLLEYVSNNSSKVPEDILNQNLGVVYESAGGIFYFECDTKLGSKTTDYGSIMFFNYMKHTGSSFYFTTIATIWSTNTLNNYTVVYTQKMAKDVKPEAASEIRNNKMITVIDDYFNKALNGFDISNVRIGLIERNTNSWIEKYAEEQTNSHIPEVTADNNYNVYEENIDNSNQNNIETETTVSKGENQNNIETETTIPKVETQKNNNNSSNNYSEENNKQEETNTIEIEKKDTSFEMTSLEITSNLTSNTEYYILRGKVNVKFGKDADWSKYSNFTTTINGQKVSSSGDTIDDGYMWFYASYNHLAEGENEFDIVVTDADGNSISKSIIVTYATEDN